MELQSPRTEALKGRGNEDEVRISRTTEEGDKVGMKRKREDSPSVSGPQITLFPTVTLDHMVLSARPLTTVWRWRVTTTVYRKWAWLLEVKAESSSWGTLTTGWRASWSVLMISSSPTVWTVKRFRVFLWLMFVWLIDRWDPGAGEAEGAGAGAGVCSGPGLWERRRSSQVEERRNRSPGLCR